METSPEQQTSSPEAETSAIDLDLLASLVLEIMRRELLLESERIGQFK